MRILIAEDDATSRLVIQATLQKAGYEVLATCDGLEALSAMQAVDAPRLAILDWMMPGIDGVEVCRHVRARETQNPPYILLLTALSRKEDIITGLEAGADDYVIKPFDRGELLARVRVGERVIALQQALNERIAQLQEALEHIRTLQGILPICAYCKKIRNDEGYWEQVDAYIRAHSDADFTHGICPDCLEKLLAESFPEKEAAT